VLVVVSTTLMRAADWPNYRGPTHDGVSTERINKNWTGSVTNPVWMVHLTNGVTSFSVSGGRAFTQVARNTNGGNREVCLALSTTNGTVLWSVIVDETASYPNGGVGVTDDGPRSTPVVYAGSVYLLTSYLKLLRLNAASGAITWSNNLVATYGGSVIAWQNAASPLIENGLIFVNANAGTQRLMALRISDGSLAWRSQDEGMTHATPVLATIHGVRQLIFATQSGLVALNPQTGALFWKFPVSYNGISLAASPVVCGDIVLVTSNYGYGATAARIVSSNSIFTASSLWNDLGLGSHWSTPVCFEGALFGQFEPDDPSAELRCIDVASGEQRWAQSGFGRGGTTLVGTNLVVITELGELVLVEANTNTYIEHGRFQAIPSIHSFFNKCWNALAISDGQVYVRSTAWAARYDLGIPELKLDAPQSAPGSKLNLTIRTVTGTPVDSNRLATMELRASTNAALSPGAWPKLTNELVFSNGIVRVTNLDAGAPRRFFIVREPQ
jgi:hypothetical protein